MKMKSGEPVLLTYSRLPTLFDNLLHYCPSCSQNSTMNLRKKVHTKLYNDNDIMNRRDDLQENGEDKVSDGIPVDS